MDVGAIKEAAADPRFKNLMLTFAWLYKNGFRGKVTVDMNGSGDLGLKAESSIRIDGDKVPKIMVLGNELSAE